MQSYILNSNDESNGSVLPTPTSNSGDNNSNSNKFDPQALPPAPQYLIGLIGCGQVGTLLMNHLLDLRFPPSSIVLASRDSQKIKSFTDRGCEVENDLKRLTCSSRIVILAVAPQHLRKVGEQIKEGKRKKGQKEDGSATILISLVSSVPSKVSERSEREYLMRGAHEERSDEYHFEEPMRSEATNIISRRFANQITSFRPLPSPYFIVALSTSLGAENFTYFGIDESDKDVRRHTTSAYNMERRRRRRGAIFCERKEHDRRGGVHTVPAG